LIEGWPLIADQVDVQIRDALASALGLPSMSLEEAARRRGEAVDGILGALGEFDVRERESGERGLFEALRADLPGADEALLLMVADDVSRYEGLVSEVARVRVAENLRAAVAAPVGRREGQVERVLAAERGRIEQRRASRLPRAIVAVTRHVRLSDEALDA
jgi:hypothetical protein